MWTRATVTKMGLLLLGVLLVAGFFGVLEKRFAEGGIYPYYASFRNDPLGTSAFYESLEGMETVTVSRNLIHLNSVTGLDADTAILLLGYPRDGFEDIRAPENSPVMKAVEEGARLVLTMNPELVPEKYQPSLSEFEDDWIERRRRLREEQANRRGEPTPVAKGGPEVEPSREENPEKGTPAVKDGKEAPESKSEGSKEKDSKKTKEQEESDELEEFEKQMEGILGPTLPKKLGFEVPSADVFERPAEGWETRAGESVGGAKVPAELPMWRSQYRFKATDEAWKPVVWVDDQPVVIERPFGKGTIVLASDTYFVSNESLHHGAEPEFLLWLIGGKGKVIFDETIHGTTETGGAMKLIRRYRGHGVILGLLAFFALWVWRSAVPLVPGSEERERGLVGGSGAVMGEGTGAGLIRLLRRSVPSAGLLAQCVEIWAQSRASGADGPQREKIDRLLARHRQDPKEFGIADAYRGIVEVLRKR